MRQLRVLTVVPLALSLALTAAFFGSSAVAHAAPSIGSRPFSYVALGDSYAAGVGSDRFDNFLSTCHQSKNNSYPELWARAHPYATLTFEACSGNSTTEVKDEQLGSLSASTALVTLTAGGDDSPPGGIGDLGEKGFAGVMLACVLEPSKECLDAVDQAVAFVLAPGFGGLSIHIDALLYAIRQKAPNATVVVLGYPQFYDIGLNTHCIPFDDWYLPITEHQLIDTAARDLNAVLQKAALAYHDRFADVDAQFKGHQLCDGDEWLHSLITPSGGSYHPTAAGQRYGYLVALEKALGEPAT